MRASASKVSAIPYAAVLDSLPVVSYLARPDGVVTRLSLEWELFTGMTERDVLEYGYEVVLHPDERARVVATWDAARLEGLRYRDEFRLRFGDGSYRSVISQANPTRNESGSIVGWIGTLTDTHELRRAEEAMARALAAARESEFELRFRANLVERLLDASDDCIKILDLDARIIFMSPNGQKALGIVDFSSIEGIDWVEFWPVDDRVAAQAAVECARAGNRGKFTGTLEVAGRQTWWEVTVTAMLASDGQPDQLLVVSRDVTEALLANRALARSEERYRILGEALPGLTFTATPDGLLDHVGGQTLSNTVPRAALLGDGWLDKVHPDDRENLRALWSASVKNGVPYDAQFRMGTPEGSYRWQLVRALPQREASGAILRWVGVNVDIDDRWHADEAREQLVRLVEASTDFIGIADQRGYMTYLNEAGRQLAGIATLDQALATPLMEYYPPENRAFAASEILPSVKRDGRWVGEFPLRHFPTGEPIPMWHDIFTLFNELGEGVGIATVSRDLRERRRFDIGMRALADTGAAMYGSLDFEGTVRNVVDAVVRSFASFCVVNILEAGGSIRSVAAANRDLTLLERVAGARNCERDGPVARAIFHGESTLMSTLPDDWIETTGMTVDGGDDIGRFDIRSIIFVPIRITGDNRVFGVLTCFLDGVDPRGTYNAEDLRFAQEIAVRAGLAFGYARAYERERRIAVTLQEASLPRVLPAVENLSLWAEYRPGSSEATIGGDWYDAFVLDDGRLAITVGDILGSGLGAAVTMSKVRQAMRSAATLIATTSAMLDVADQTVRAESADMYATALAGIYDSRSHQFTFASAGHPGPLLRHPDGRIEELSSPGVLLGLRLRGEMETVTVDALPGSTLVFFTDGLVEATRNIDEGYRRLRAALANADVTAAENPARALVAHVLGGPATDDIAVLVVEVAAVRPSP